MECMYKVNILGEKEKQEHTNVPTNHIKYVFDIQNKRTDKEKRNKRNTHSTT